MSGYKRVNFYELCRLCATNQQKEKTHIFQEEGRKIQLQNKIQTCLSLTVYEHDFLPKVVCSKCLKSLELCYTFKQECVSSESMLSSYFKNFRYTEDFKKSGKVYIKDTIIKSNIEEEEAIGIISTNCTGPSVQPTTNIVPTSYATHTQNISMAESRQQTMEPIPYYTVQIPTTIMSNQQQSMEPKLPIKSDSNKILQNAVSHQVSYNLNTINLGSIKTAVQNQIPKSEQINNVVVNANGEVINIAQLVDLESILNQANNMPKLKLNKSSRRQKECKVVSEEPIIKIDLTNNEPSNYDTGQSEIMKYDKSPHIKSTHNNKYSYSVKVEEKAVNVNPTVIFNTVPDYNQNSNVSTANFTNYNTSNLYPTSNINIVGTTNGVVGHTANVCSTPNEHSTVNLNAISDLGNTTSFRGIHSGYSNSSKSCTVLQNTANLNKNSSPNQQNVSTSSGNISLISPESKNQIEKVHVCDICHKSFKRREHLYQHIKLHTGFRPYTCENCNKSFMRKEHLLRHMTSHSGLKNFTCNICDKSFSRNDNLLKHKKTHDKQSSFTCEVCQKQFVMKHYYLAHKVTHDVVDRCIGQTMGILKA